jgi:hypothetical protein
LLIMKRPIIAEVVGAKGHFEAAAGQAPLAREAGVVDEHVEGLFAGQEGLGAGANAGEIAQVEGQEFGEATGPADGVEHGLGTVKSAAGEEDTVAPPGEIFCGDAPDAGVGTGDEEGAAHGFPGEPSRSGRR